MVKEYLRRRERTIENEFDLDYVGYLREQKRMGEITATQEKAFLDDNWNKTVYEMDNMFKSTNRATYGKFATFQPALCEEDLINSPTSMLITVDRLNDALDYLRSVDYSLFYHEIVFRIRITALPRKHCKKKFCHTSY